MSRNHSGGFRDFAVMMKRLERGQTVMFHKPYPPEGNQMAFYLGRLTKQGVLKRKSFPAHTEFSLIKGMKLTHGIRGDI